MSSTLIYNASVWQWKSSKVFEPRLLEEIDGKSCDVELGYIEPNCYVVIRNGYFVEVVKYCDLYQDGVDASLPLPPFESFDTVINANNQLLLPGLIDSHIHVSMVGESQYFVDLRHCDSIDSLRNTLKAHMQMHPENELPWIVGVNWDQTVLGRYPNRFDIDGLALNEEGAEGERPVFLWRSCWHIGLANTRALELANIIIENGGDSSIAAAISPPGGVIDMMRLDMMQIETTGDWETRNATGINSSTRSSSISGAAEAPVPSGILKERAVELVIAAQQQYLHKFQARGLRMSTNATVYPESESKRHASPQLRFLSEGMAKCVKVGLTTVQTNDEGTLHLYRQLQEENLLPLRVFLTPCHAELHRPYATAATATTTTTRGTTGNDSEHALLVVGGGAAAEGIGIAGVRPFRPMCFSRGLTTFDSAIAIIGDCKQGSTTTTTTTTTAISSFSSTSSQSTAAPAFVPSACDMESRLLMERVKIFSDGSLGAETAAIRTLAPAAETPPPPPTLLPSSPSATPATNATNAAAASITATTSTSISASASSTSSTCASTGVLVHKQEELVRMLGEAAEAGYRVEIHAIGDAAAEQVLLAIETHTLRHQQQLLLQQQQSIHGTGALANTSSSLTNGNECCWRPILTHCQVLGPDLIAKMHQLNVIANIQPSFVPTDMKWVRERISKVQINYSYVWKTLMNYTASTNQTAGFSTGGDAEDPKNNTINNDNDDNGGGTSSGRGLHVAGGSDAPIESCNPFTGIHDAMFRSNRHRQSNSDSNADSNISNDEDSSVFLPQERLTFSQALWLYTIGGAFAAGVEHRLGQLPRAVNSRTAGECTPAANADAGPAGAAGLAGASSIATATTPAGDTNASSGLYVGDAVLVDMNVLKDPSRLLELTPHIVLVGGIIEAVADESAKSMVERSSDRSWGTHCSSTSTSSSSSSSSSATPASSTSFPQGTFLPGRGGGTSSSSSHPNYGSKAAAAPAAAAAADTGLICMDVNGFAANGLRCACMLRGKYCGTA